MTAAARPDAGEAELLASHGLALVRAANPGPLTLTGTNSFLIGRDPAWVVDPGPLLPDHIASLTAEIDARGGLGGIALTHDHADHAQAVPALRERYGAPVGAARGNVEVTLADGERFGPFEAAATPGHAVDHLAFVAGPVCFTGDAVLGAGSVFIAPGPGAMAGYLRALERLREREGLELLCPGHGPVVREPRAKLDEYIAHRRDRERRLRAALAEGRRSVKDLLDAAWDDAPEQLRPAAAATLAAHLDKLEAEGELPPGVERPPLAGTLAS
jgi:glyoxylase-like metal-dependent hydrolase (beta-lactamase superfamily II)